MTRLVTSLRGLCKGLRKRSIVNSEIDEEFLLHMQLRAEDLVRSACRRRRPDARRGWSSAV